MLPVKILKFKSLLLSAFLLTSPIHADELLTGTWMNVFKAPNFSEMKDIHALKKSFFNYLLPQIKQQSAKILKLRDEIKSGTIKPAKLREVYKHYRVTEGDVEALLARVDVVPASLILAQAAYESNWGRSRFAKDYNNYFGIWCFKKGCGVVPLKLDKNATHEVAKFDSLAKNMAYYLHTINRNSAYKTLRKIRKDKRDKNLPVTSMELAEGLERYSGIGHKYVETVHSIIRYNKLARFDLIDPSINPKHSK